MDEDEFLIAALLTQIIKGETTTKEAAEKLIPEQEQTLHKLCVDYYDYVDTLEFELAEDGKLSAATEADVRQATIDAAHFAPGHFRIVAD